MFGLYLSYTHLKTETVLKERKYEYNCVLG